jgi:hypothetical protein
MNYSAIGPERRKAREVSVSGPGFELETLRLRSMSTVTDRNGRRISILSAILMARCDA